MNISLNTKKLVTAMIAASAFGLCATAANAGLFLHLKDSNGNSLTIADGQLGPNADASAGVNDIISYSNTNWFGWNFSVTTGNLTPFASGQRDLAILMQSWNNVTGGGAANNLFVTIEAQGIVQPVGNFFVDGILSGGKNANQVGASANINGAFNPYNLILPAGTLPTPVASATTAWSHFAPMTVSNTVTLTNGQITLANFNSTLTLTDKSDAGGFDVPVPEPASLTLLGLGLVGLGFVRRRNSGAQSKSV